MRAVLSPPEPDGQILYRPYMDSYKRTPKPKFVKCYSLS